MLQLKAACVQRLTRELAQLLDQFRARTRRNTQAPAVHRVAHQRKVDIAHMHADLVGAPGFQLDLDVGMGAEAVDHAIVTDRLLAAGHYRHLLALSAVPGNRLVDLATGRHHAGDHTLVFATDRACLQLGHQIGLRLDGFGDNHQAGGVFIQTMNDTCTRDLGQLRAMVQQRVQQRAVLVSCRRVHHQARRLVDHQQGAVFIQDIQLDRLGLPLALHLPLGIQGQLLAAVHAVARALALAINQQAAVLDPALQPRA